MLCIVFLYRPSRKLTAIHPGRAVHIGDWRPFSFHRLTCNGRSTKHALTQHFIAKMFHAWLYGWLNANHINILTLGWRLEVQYLKYISKNLGITVPANAISKEPTSVSDRKLNYKQDHQGQVLPVGNVCATFMNQGQLVRAVSWTQKHAKKPMSPWYWYSIGFWSCQGTVHVQLFMQNFIKLSAAVHELSCKQRNRERKKLSDDAENNTAIACASRSNDSRQR